MVQGELVYCRGSGKRKPGWGVVLQCQTVYLPDDTMMVSWEILFDGKVKIFDDHELVTFQFYNRHLYHDRICLET